MNEEKANELYSLLKDTGRRGYDVQWIAEQTKMSPEEINVAGALLESQGLVKLRKDVGGNYPYNFNDIEVLRD